MDYIAPKIAKSRTQKRQKRLIRNRRRNQQRKLEVKSSKQHKLMRDNSNIPSKQSGIYCTMAANAFWENYKVAHDWQHRHNVVWWKSRCIALENENCILRNKIREQATSFTTDIHQIENKFPENYRNHYRTEREVGGDAEVKEKIEVEDNNKSEDINEENSNVDNEDLEDLEFHVDEDMMKFLEQSIRHKMRLKLMRESEDEKSSENYKTELKIENREALASSKIEDSKLLYGTASTRILAMEAAMQASIDQHNDRSKPHYWPNIPLKP